MKKNYNGVEKFHTFWLPSRVPPFCNRQENIDGPWCSEDEKAKTDVQSCSC